MSSTWRANHAYVWIVIGVGRGERLALLDDRGQPVAVALGGELAVELGDEQAPVGEDEDAHRAGRLDEPRGGDRLAGRGRVPEAEAANGAGILSRRRLLGEQLLVDDCRSPRPPPRRRPARPGRSRSRCRSRLLGLALVGGDQLGEHPGERVHLMAAQLGSGREARRLLGQHALEAEHEREVHLPLRGRLLVAGLDLGERLVERVPARRSRREHLGRILVAVEEGLAGPVPGRLCAHDEIVDRRSC